MTPVRLKPAAPRSRVKHSTTKPLRSLLQNGMYRGHYLRICGKASGIMPVLGEFLKLVFIKDITYVSVERSVELCQYCGNSSNWYV